MDLRARVDLWIRALQPSEIDKVMEEQKGKESLKQAFFNIFLASLIPALIAIVAFTLLFAFVGALGAMGLEPGHETSDPMVVAAFAGVAGIFFGLIYAAVMIFVTPIAFLFMQVMHFALARLLGGRASFTRQAYLMGLVFAALDAASVLSLVPCAGGLVVGILGIVSIYTDYKIIKSIHSLGRIRAAIATLVPLLIAMIIYILLEIATAE